MKSFGARCCKSGLGKITCGSRGLMERCPRQAQKRPKRMYRAGFACAIRSRTRQRLRCQPQVHKFPWRMSPR